jgi:hypothetical protein
MYPLAVDTRVGSPDPVMYGGGQPSAHFAGLRQR